MLNKTIANLTPQTAIANADKVPFWKTSNGETSFIAWSAMVGSLLEDAEGASLTKAMTQKAVTDNLKTKFSLTGNVLTARAVFGSSSGAFGYNVVLNGAVVSGMNNDGRRFAGTTASFADTDFSFKGFDDLNSKYGFQIQNLSNTHKAWFRNDGLFSSTGGLSTDGVRSISYDTVNNRGFLGNTAGAGQSGNEVFFAGLDAGALNTAGNTVGIGSYALGSNTGVSSAGVGWASLFQNTGVYSSALGYHSGRQNIGDYLTAFGFQAGYLNIGGRSTFCGADAGASNAASYAVGIGSYALGSNTGVSSVGIGEYALFQNSGIYSSGVGHYSGWQNTGDYLTAFGFQAGYLNTGGRSTFYGLGAGYGNAGSSVCGFGGNSARLNTTSNIFTVGEINQIFWNNIGDKGFTTLQTVSMQAAMSVDGTNTSASASIMSYDAALGTGNASPGNLTWRYAVVQGSGYTRHTKALALTMNGATGKFTFEKTINVPLVDYANNAAAIAGGLIVNDFYRTGGAVNIVI